MSNKRPFYVDLGQDFFFRIGLPTVAYWENSTRPKNAKEGSLGFNSQTSSLEYFNGSHWLEAQMATSRRSA